jgi:hypothetical protein
LLITLGVIVLSRPFGMPWQLGAILVAVGLFDIAWGFRASSSISPELDAVFKEAERLAKSNPAAGEQVLDRYFEGEAARKEEELSDLRKRAQYNVGAARRLEALLRQELDGHRSMRRRVIPTLPDERRLIAMAQVEEMERQTRSELERLHASLRLLKG